MGNNEKLLRMEQVLLNEAERLLTKEAMEGMCRDLRDAEEVEEAAAMLTAYAFGLDPGERVQDREFVEGWLRPSMKMLSPTPFEENPYFSEVTFPEATRGDVRLTHLRYEPYQVFPAGDLWTDERGRLRAPLGFFGEAWEYPALMEGEREWMTLTPNEIITMEASVGKARGRVLVMGLGLGYYAYRCCGKETVSEVTVVERDRSIIEIFEEHLLGQFPEGKRPKIVEDDAIEYLEKYGTRERYDYVFADLWHDVSDGLPLYRRIKEIVSKGEQMAETDCWIAQTMEVYGG